MQSGHCGGAWCDGPTARRRIDGRDGMSGGSAASAPPRSLLALAVVILTLYLLSPSAAIARVHTVLQPPQRTLVESIEMPCIFANCPPPPPPPKFIAGLQPVEDLPPPPQQLAASPPPPRTLASPPPSPSPTLEPGCESNGECSVDALVRLHAVDNTVVVTFGNMRQSHFTENWVYHLRRLGVGGLLVGMMNMRADQQRYVRLAGQLRPLGVGVYTVNSPEVKKQPQGGRWFHVLPLLATGARVLLSDSDVVWMRDPRPYLKRLEERHPVCPALGLDPPPLTAASLNSYCGRLSRGQDLDFTVSSDAQGGSDGRRLGAANADRASARQRELGRPVSGAGARRAGAHAEAAADDDLDIEEFGHCWTSMNIGIMHFAPGRRPGTLESMNQAVAHLSIENNLGRVDQGPINYRWKFGAGKWRWQRQLHPVRDRSGKRLCGLLNGTSVGGVLPSAQFCNTLTHSVLQLWKATAGGPVKPYVVHATWMRNQAEPFKRMRLREETVWRDPPSWYGAGPRGNTRRVTALGATDPPAGYIAYEPRLPAEWLQVHPMAYKGGIPTHHLALIHQQLRQLRNAFFIARALGRALILPHTIGSCEMVRGVPSPWKPSEALGSPWKPLEALGIGSPRKAFDSLWRSRAA